MVACFHCGEVLPAQPYQFKVLGEMRAMCCMGCYAVAEAIVDAGLEHYYQERDVISPTAPLPEALEVLQGYDHPDTQQQFLHREHDFACAELSIEGVSCAACAWLIERRLGQEPSVKQATVNLSSHRTARLPRSPFSYRYSRSSVETGISTAINAFRRGGTGFNASNDVCRQFVFRHRYGNPVP
jgi:copper chaperone CopZ